MGQKRYGDFINTGECEIMVRNDFDSATFKIIEKAKAELMDMEGLTNVVAIKEKLRGLISFIDEETTNNKIIFAEKIYWKVKETRDTNPELNTCLYMLYRVLMEGKVPLNEAQKLYNMYLSEYGELGKDSGSKSLRIG